MKNRVDIRVNRAQSELKFHTIDGDDIVSFSGTSHISFERGIFFPAGSSFDFVNLATCCETRREQGECTREIASGTPMDWTCHTIDLPVGSPGTLFICAESVDTRERDSPLQDTVCNFPRFLSIIRCNDRRFPPLKIFHN